MGRDSGILCSIIANLQAGFWRGSTVYCIRQEEKKACRKFEHKYATDGSSNGCGS